MAEKKKRDSFDHGDLTRILLVLDGRLDQIRNAIKKAPVKPLEDYYTRLVATRNKVQEAWKDGIPVKRKAAPKKARKARD